MLLRLTLDLRELGSQFEKIRRGYVVRSSGGLALSGSIFEEARKERGSEEVGLSEAFIGREAAPTPKYPADPWLSKGLRCFYAPIPAILP